MQPLKRKIRKIIVHCSASMWGDAQVIDSWHKQRGWRGIGYHFVILNGVRRSGGRFERRWDGLVELGRDLEERGAHCKGHNTDSVGICLIGMRHFTLGQFRALVELCTDLMERIPELSVRDIYGHKELNPSKSCPTFDMDDIRKIMRLKKGG